METTERSANYVRFAFPPAGVALVLGNEEVGVDVDVLAECDAIVEARCIGAGEADAPLVVGAASIMLLVAWRSERTSSSISACCRRLTSRSTRC